MDHHPAPPTDSESSPLLSRSSSPESPPRPIPRAVVATHWVSSLGGLLVSILAFAVVLVNILGPNPARFHLPFDIGRNLIKMVVAGFMSAAFSTASLLRLRRVGALMPAFVAVLFHIGMALWFVITSALGAGDIAGGPSRMCYGYGLPGIPEDNRQCYEWAEKVARLLWVYLGAIFALGLVHTALFIFTCSGPLGSWRENIASWDFPAGRLSVEFSVKFLKQEMPAAAARDAAPAARGD
ncbi:hypothetical protein QBC34DRAFT_397885 [Podospora aff. communis PSN243]|uniref:MARVEL domain-containing protein n=1 Tax=Podospora aff. communis PSN243 TaxID=3040156 RepID=A0AAV9GXG6_9PEZI|nr:hypothetical protein QBC34DRAFT_397885 [Podospora aff. communis PSN243]